MLQWTHTTVTGFDNGNHELHQPEVNDQRLPEPGRSRLSDSYVHTVGRRSVQPGHPPLAHGIAC